MALSVFGRRLVPPLPASDDFWITASQHGMTNESPRTPMRGPLNKEQRVIPDKLNSASSAE